MRRHLAPEARTTANGETVRDYEADEAARAGLMPWKQVAAVMGLSPRSCQVYGSTAVRKFRQILKDAISRERM